MSICSGMLLLGLCLPIPGMKQQSLERAGWVLTNDQPGRSDSYASVWMRWNELLLLVGVSVEFERVKLVHIYDRKSKLQFAVEGWLKGHCRLADSQWRCPLARPSFVATRCGGGWILTADSALDRDGGVSELCGRIKPLFEEGTNP